MWLKKRAGHMCLQDGETETGLCPGHALLGGVFPLFVSLSLVSRHVLGQFKKRDRLALTSSKLYLLVLL